MGQPTPPGDMPLVDGLGPEWNEFVSAMPEDKRAELGPKLRERVSSYESQLKEFEPWDDFRKSGVTPDQTRTALDVFKIIENNPRQVYDTLASHLGITSEQAEEVVEELGNADQDDSRIQTMQDQINTLAQLAVTERQQNQREQQIADQEAAIDADLEAVKNKYGTHDFNEREILMRMMHEDMSAEDAYNDYMGHVTEVRRRRPAPMIMGSGGAIPSKAIDPTKLPSKEVKSIVSQMLDSANAEARQ